MNILITGGASGLGLEITKVLASPKGNKVNFTYCQSKKEAGELVKSLPNTRAIQCDFREHKDIDHLLECMSGMDLDLLVNNVALNLTVEHFHKMDPKIFLDNFTHLMLPTIRITQKVIQDFRKKKSGRIINVLSSCIVNKPPVGMSEYAALKSYLFSLSKSWATENAHFNITSNCVSPDFMQTKLTAGKDPRMVELYAQSHPLKKILTPKEVADSILFLANCSVQINGINLVINSAQDIP